MRAKIGSTTIRLDRPIALAQPLGPATGPFRAPGPGNPEAFHAPAFTAEPVRAGGFVGATTEGGPVNFLNLALNPHGNGTHTEGVGHIAREPVGLHEVLRDPFAWALLVDAPPEPRDGDAVITDAALHAAVAAGGPAPESGPRALVLRTGPSAERAGRRWSGGNPPYLEAAALARLAGEGWTHLLLDLPSVDREEDGGALAGHRAWWRYPGTPEAPVRREATITELIVVPDALPAGWYALWLQVPPFTTDAAPSSPLLYPLE